MSKFIEDIYRQTGWSKEDWLKYPDCPKCRENYTNELNQSDRIFTYRPNAAYIESASEIVINIDESYRTIVDARKQMDFFKNPKDIQKLVSQNQIDSNHINHLTGNPPGVVILFHFTRKDTGETHQEMVLAEGNHRAQFSCNHKVPFSFYYFDSNETQKLVVK